MEKEIETKKRQRDRLDAEIKTLETMEGLVIQTQIIEKDIQNYVNDINAIMKKMGASEREKDRLKAEICALENTLQLDAPKLLQPPVEQPLLSSLIQFFSDKDEVLITQDPNDFIAWKDFSNAYSSFCRLHNLKIIPLGSKKAYQTFEVFHISVTDKKQPRFNSREQPVMDYLLIGIKLVR